MSEEKKPPQENQQVPDITEKTKVPIKGYFALIFAIIFFSGIFAQRPDWVPETWNWVRAFDFNVISGGFGTVANAVSFNADAGTVSATRTNFVGVGGNGARHGFMFALTLLPIVLFALGTVQVVDHLGGLKAAQKLLTPILRPLMGIPGICGLALITSFQSTDGGAGMNRTLREANHITEDEKTIFGAFQFSAGGTLTNYLASGAALFAFITVPIGTPLVVIFVMKVFGANIVRFYLKKFDRKKEKANG